MHWGIALGNTANSFCAPSGADQPVGLGGMASQADGAVVEAPVQLLLAIAIIAPAWDMPFPFAPPILIAQLRKFVRHVAEHLHCIRGGGTSGADANTAARLEPPIHLLLVPAEQAAILEQKTCTCEFIINHISPLSTQPLTHHLMASTGSPSAHLPLGR